MQNHDIRSLQPRKHVRTIGVFFLAALCGVQVAAQTAATGIPTDKAFAGFMANVVGSGQQTVNFATGGQAVLSTASGNLAASASGTVAVGGKALPVVAEAQVVKASLGKAMVGLLKASVAPLAVGLAAYDVVVALDALHKWAVNKKPDGGLVFQQTVDSSMVFQCYSAYPYGVHECLSSDQLATILSAYHRDPAWIAFDHYPYTQCSGGLHYAFWYQTAQNPGFGHFVCSRQVDVREEVSTGGKMEERTEQQFIDAVAAKSGWPATSHLAEATKQAIDAGEKIEFEPQKTVTGPASTPGEKVTTTNPDGTKTTTQTTNNYKYDGNTITVTNSTVSTNYNPVTNNTTTTTTEKENAEEKATDCELHPDTAGCQKLDLDVPDGEIPKTTKNITFAPENLGFGGGSCPSDVMVSVHNMQSVKAFDWVSACGYITDYVKPMFLALSGFAALMILFAGGKAE